MSPALAEPDRCWGNAFALHNTSLYCFRYALLRHICCCSGSRDPQSVITWLVDCHGWRVRLGTCIWHVFRNVAERITWCNSWNLKIFLMRSSLSILSIILSSVWRSERSVDFCFWKPYCASATSSCFYKQKLDKPRVNWAYKDLRKTDNADIGLKEVPSLVLERMRRAPRPLLSYI